MKLTGEQIKKINESCPMEWQENEQGIFVQPFGVPVHIKEPVVYMRWESGGVSGGSCWDNSNPQRYEQSKPENVVIDLVLKELKPNFLYSQFREIKELIHSNSETEYEYYGNSTDFEVEYIILSELIQKLEKL